MSVGESQKMSENIMELIVKIEKTNTMTNTRRKTKTDKDKNVDPVGSTVRFEVMKLCTGLV